MYEIFTSKFSIYRLQPFRWTYERVSFSLGMYSNKVQKTPETCHFMLRTTSSGPEHTAFKNCILLESYFIYNILLTYYFLVTMYGMPLAIRQKKPT